MGNEGRILPLDPQAEALLLLGEPRIAISNVASGGNSQLYGWNGGKEWVAGFGCWNGMMGRSGRPGSRR